MIIPFYVECEYELEAAAALEEVGLAFYQGAPLSDKTLEEVECRLEHK